MPCRRFVYSCSTDRYETSRVAEKECMLLAANCIGISLQVLVWCTNGSTIGTEASGKLCNHQELTETFHNHTSKRRRSGQDYFNPVAC